MLIDPDFPPAKQAVSIVDLARFELASVKSLYFTLFSVRSSFGIHGSHGEQPTIESVSGVDSPTLGLSHRLPIPSAARYRCHKPQESYAATSSCSRTTEARKLSAHARLSADGSLLPVTLNCSFVTEDKRPRHTSDSASQPTSKPMTGPKWKGTGGCGRSDNPVPPTLPAPNFLSRKLITRRRPAFAYPNSTDKL